MKRRILIYLILFQLAAIGGIFLSLMKKTDELKAKVVVNPMERGEQIFTKVAGLKYFYEPKPDSVSHIATAWGKNNVSATYRINNDGLNQIRNFPAEKKEETTRIVTLGDSFTFGLNVDTENNYPSLLQNILDSECKEKFEVLNLGVAGYDIRYIVERYKLRGIKYKPDLVVWFLRGGEFRRFNESTQPKIDHLLASFEKKGEQVNNSEFHLKFLQFSDEAIMESGGKEKFLKMQASYLHRISDYYEGKLIISSYESMTEEYRKIVADFQKKEDNIHLHRMHDFYNEEQFSLEDGHPSKDGHKKMAESLFEYLISENHIKCSREV